MKYTRIIRSASIQGLEDKINELLVENRNDKFIDIKYSSTYTDRSVIYSAIIIFEKG